MSKNLYKRFSQDENFDDVDHIVVGSGIGGLTVAIWLAKAGEKVVVLERHHKPGGFTHSFVRKGNFQWDTGVHYVGGLEAGSSIRKLFNLLTNFKLKWEPIGDIYDVVKIGDDSYNFIAGKENFRKQLIEYFPEEENTINAYLELIVKANKRGGAFFFEKTFKPILHHAIGWVFKKRYEKYSQRTTIEVLNELTSNKRLIAVLCAQFGNYGLSPKQSSFAAHSMIVNHFIEGGYYPKGGTDEIGNKAIETLNAFGGRVFVSAEVNEIVTDKNRTKGVIVGDTFIACKSVISNAGVYNTFNHLLTDDAKRRCKFDLKEVEPSSGHMCLYVGLDKSSKDLNLPKHNIWCFEDENVHDIMDEITLSEAPKKFAYFSFPSAKDPYWDKDHPNMATIQAITAGYYKWFTEYEDQQCMNRDQAYMNLKKEFEDVMLDRLYKMFPQLKGHVVITEVSSPLSTKHFCNSQHGEIYGLAHTPNRFKLPFLRPETKIKGLRLVGQDIMIVGLASAMVSGMFCAITILKFKVWRLFKEMNQSA